MMFKRLLAIGLGLLSTPTKAYDATEATETQTQTSSTIYPYSDNFKYNYNPPITMKETHDDKIPTIEKIPITSIKIPTTLMTMTTSNTTSTSPAPTAITTITGCRTVADCPRCSPHEACRIGKLFPFCVGNPSRLRDEAPQMWQGCREQLKYGNITREERKAWAVHIAPPNCLSIDEWAPKDIHDGICHSIVQGWRDEPEAQGAWISGLLPIQCPYDIGDGEWENYPEELRKMCRKAAEVLYKPFKQ